MFRVPSSGPTLKLVLFWNGTLMRLPTGFCASFASSSAFISGCAGAAATSATPKVALASQVVFIRNFICFYIRRMPAPRNAGTRPSDRIVVTLLLPPSCSDRVLVSSSDVARTLGL